jgi:flagellar biosynthesis GTPase FlhF
MSQKPHESSRTAILSLAGAIGCLLLANLRVARPADLGPLDLLGPLPPLKDEPATEQELTPEIRAYRGRPLNRSELALWAALDGAAGGGTSAAEAQGRINEASDALATDALAQVPRSAASAPASSPDRNPAGFVADPRIEAALEETWQRPAWGAMRVPEVEPTVVRAQRADVSGAAAAAEDEQSDAPIRSFATHITGAGSAMLPELRATDVEVGDHADPSVTHSALEREQSVEAAPVDHEYGTTQAVLEYEPAVEAAPMSTTATVTHAVLEYEPAVEAAPTPTIATVTQAPLDPAADIAATLRDRGLGEALTARLIEQARAHQLPFARTADLREAVRSEIATLLPTFAGLPARGAAVAVIGAGGSGKTRVVAALAAAYRASSALSVRTVVLGGSDRVAPLAGLLAPHGVPVGHGDAHEPHASRTTEPRDGEIVVIDTPGVSASNPAAVGLLGGQLADHALDAVLVALPVRTAASAAAQLLAALAPARPAALVLTHADETDQLGAAIEVSIDSGLPIAYVHSGLDLPTALQLADPRRLAAALLP